MNNSINNNSLKDSQSDILNWNLIQTEMKNKLGLDIYDSWLKKIDFVDEFNNYILLSVPTTLLAYPFGLLFLRDPSSLFQSHL